MLQTSTKPTIDAGLNEVESELTAAYERLVGLLSERHPSLAADFRAASTGLFVALGFLDDMLADSPPALPESIRSRHEQGATCDDQR